MVPQLTSPFGERSDFAQRRPGEGAFLLFSPNAPAILLPVGDFEPSRRQRAPVAPFGEKAMRAMLNGGTEGRMRGAASR